jgi:hypothetical protein
MSISMYAERLVVAGSRRSGDEIHPWPPNGDLRPVPVVRDSWRERRLSDRTPVVIGLDSADIDNDRHGSKTEQN